jgi:hypothetical protein
MVTQNPAEIENQVVVNGNFDTDYDAMSFKNFQVNSIRFLGGRRNFEWSETEILSNTSRTIGGLGRLWMS